MIFANGADEFLHVTCPGEGPSCLQVPLIRIIVESFKLKRVVAVGDVVTLPVCPSDEIEQAIEEPVKNEQHFHLLPEVDLLMPHELCLIAWRACDPDKDEER